MDFPFDTSTLDLGRRSSIRKKKKKEQGGRGKIGLWKKKKERKAGMYAMPNYEDFIAG